MEERDLEVWATDRSVTRHDDGVKREVVGKGFRREAHEGEDRDGGDNNQAQSGNSEVLANFFPHAFCRP